MKNTDDSSKSDERPGWIKLDEILKVVQAARDGTWSVHDNMACKHMRIGIDMRGHSVTLTDIDGNPVSLERFQYQFSKDPKNAPKPPKETTLGSRIMKGELAPEILAIAQKVIDEHSPVVVKSQFRTEPIVSAVPMIMKRGIEDTTSRSLPEREYAPPRETWATRFAAMSPRPPGGYKSDIVGYMLRKAAQEGRPVKIEDPTGIASVMANLECNPPIRYDLPLVANALIHKEDDNA